MASSMFWPCETRTSTCRSFATISSGLYRFLAIAVLLDVKAQVGPLHGGGSSAGQNALLVYLLPDLVTSIADMAGLQFYVWTFHSGRPGALPHAEKDPTAQKAW